MLCLEQALKQNRKSWKIWENYIIMCLETFKFHKAVAASRQIIRQGMIERLNAGLLLRVCDVFLKNYVVNKPAGSEEEKKAAEDNLAVNKKQLYAFFEEYTSQKPQDWQVWRLLCRVKGVLKEKPEEIKDLKLKEIKAL